MASRSRLALVLVAVTCIVLTGCAAPEIPLPPETIPPGTVSGSPVDLTNQNSPLAAPFRNGNSYTPLITPGPYIGLLPVAGGLSAPMMIAAPDDGSGRLFVVDQVGIVRIIGPDNALRDIPFLDVRDRMISLTQGYDERGLLSLAFHPDYRRNGRVFVYYSAPLQPGAPAGWCCTDRLSEFFVNTSNPDMVDPGSERILLSIDHPSFNHHGGPILFGPDDGYLYVAFGDGGGAGDTGIGHTPGGNAQDGSTLLGKIIRIDIDRAGLGGRSYAIPPDNPFVSTPGILPEIYAMGFRNPAYLSFDPGDGHHLIAAVAGQQLFESVYIITKGGNYGWNIREGTHCFNPSSYSRPPPAGSCPITGSRGEPLIGPIIELGHDLGSAIVGGSLYRGTTIPGMSGAYIFGDWSGNPSGGGSILVATPPEGMDISTYPDTAGAVTPQDNRMWTTREFRIANTSRGRVDAFVRWIGEGPDHEIYVLTSRVTGPDSSTATGEVWKIAPP
ncbi:MAG: PQQ-dependent sugar dehydrogenase [Methanoregulaceae archaeon]|nr:PQQ-dependent sugar dehydrogenase [Methanoregulaceae archaeon]